MKVKILKDIIKKIDVLFLKKSYIPALEYILLKDKKIIYTNMVYVFSIDFLYYTGKEVLINFIQLKEIIKKLSNNDEIQLVNENNNFYITTFEQHYKVDIFPPEEYKKYVDLSILNSEYHDIDELINGDIDILLTSKFFTRKADTGSIILEFVEIDNEYIVSTNNLTLFFKKRKYFNKCKEKYLIDRKLIPLFNNIKKIVISKIDFYDKDSSKEKEILYSYLKFTTINFTLYQKFQDGKFPNWKEILPDKRNELLEFTYSKKDMSISLKYIHTDYFDFVFETKDMEEGKIRLESVNNIESDLPINKIALEACININNQGYKDYIPLRIRFNKKLFSTYIEKCESNYINEILYCGTNYKKDEQGLRIKDENGNYIYDSPNISEYDTTFNKLNDEFIIMPYNINV